MAAEWWITAAPQPDRRGAPDGPSERAPDDVDDLVHIGVGLAVLGGGPHAARDVVLEDDDRQGIDRGAQGGRLLEDVDAVLLALDHPGDAADLALHPRQAADELGLVLRIAVSEVAGVGRRCGCARRPSVGLIGGRSSIGRWRRTRRRDQMIPPGGIDGHACIATGVAPVDLPPMGPRDRPSPLPDGASCTACGAPVPTGRIRLLASRDGLAFVRLVCDDCGSAAIGLLVDDVDGRRPRPRCRADGTPADDARRRPGRTITAADVDAVRRDLAAWDGDLVGWLDR